MDKHDTVYKLLFSHDRMVRDLLVGFLPGQWTAAPGSGFAGEAERQLCHG